MTTQRTDQFDPDRVGTRPRAEVEERHDALEADALGPHGGTQLSRGALTGYQWALGRGDGAPVTGAVARSTPDMDLLTAEVDAATVQLEAGPLRTLPRDYTQGVHDALAWVCGHTEVSP
ncbi:hypothetical protein ABT246_08580 [Streptomyces sp. NPDC001553]|uniref:hypothetical protein n=1 Tax=Streptomyces sp. NPDC001553 TaxID=3154385 RepID=UPI003317D6D9